MYQTDIEHGFKFSIISAVYNVEDYLAEAIESIIEQDIGFCDSVQLILVDDGSTDRSGMICDEYQAKYPDNIIVIHKKNEGVASARNAGISAARGKYVNFMDSDDKLSETTLSAIYKFFMQHHKNVDIAAIPIFYFENKSGPHRLNYKFKDGNDRIINLIEEYSYVQMSAASAFFKREILNPDAFDTSLRYAEDAKLLMTLFLENPQYGIVPEGCYLYRARNSMDSALNGSKQHREWYIDCLKNYIFWALDTAEKKYGYIPKFVQYNIMYDLQGRFKVDEIPESVLSVHEKEIFLKMLFSAVCRIDDHIVLEQKNLSRELKDYIISIKKAPDSGTLVLDEAEEDFYFHYSDLDTYHASSYLVQIDSIEVIDKDIFIKGAAKIYLRFPYPSRIFLRLKSKENVHIIECCFHEDEDRTFYFDKQKLAVFLDFSAVISYKLLSASAQIEFCMESAGHTICFKNIHAAPELYTASKKQTLKVNRKIYSCHLKNQTLFFDRNSFWEKVKNKIRNLIKTV